MPGFPYSLHDLFHHFTLPLKSMATRTGNQNGATQMRTQCYLNAADFFLQAKNFDDCRKNAFRAQTLDPIHPGPNQLLAIASVISAAASAAAHGGSRQRPDFYSILGVPRFTGDVQLIKTRVEKLRALLNPRENRFALAEEAYRLVTEAWMVLSVPAQRALYDDELKTKQKFGNGSEIRSFWTMCPYCYYVYEYPIVYKECCMRCRNEKCRRAFHAVEIPPPPPEVAATGKFFCPGFMPVRVEGGGGNGMDSWTPFAPVGLGANGDKVKFPNQAFGEMKIDNENGIERGTDRAGKSQNVEINGHCGETTDGNVGMKKKLKMVAKSTKKLMGKGVRIEVIDAEDDDNCTGFESELIGGKLEFVEEDDDVCVCFHPGF